MEYFNFSSSQVFGQAKKYLRSVGVTEVEPDYCVGQTRGCQIILCSTVPDMHVYKMQSFLRSEKTL